MSSSVVANNHIMARFTQLMQEHADPDWSMSHWVALWETQGMMFVRKGGERRSISLTREEDRHRLEISDLPMLHENIGRAPFQILIPEGAADYIGDWRIDVRKAEASAPLVRAMQDAGLWDERENAWEPVIAMLRFIFRKDGIGPAPARPGAVQREEKDDPAPT